VISNFARGPLCFRYRHIYCEGVPRLFRGEGSEGDVVSSGCRAERGEFLLAVVHRLLIGWNAEEDALNFLQDRAVELAGWRDCGELAQETYGAAEEGLEAFLIDQLAQVVCAPGGGED
jgi:hypothetical protein